MKSKLPIISFILVALILGFALGMGWEEHRNFAEANDLTVDEAENITQEKAIRLLTYCVDSHQYYADNPIWTSSLRGDVEFHKEWVANYKAIIKYIRSR